MLCKITIPIANLLKLVVFKSIFKTIFSLIIGHITITVVNNIVKVMNAKLNFIP